VTTLILQILAGLLPVVVALVEEWRQRETRYQTDCNAMDQALARHDAAAVSALFERLRPPGGVDGAAGGPDGRTATMR